jgi:hypothetical protein
MALFTLTLEDNVDGTVEVKSDQDLPFSNPERATHAQLLSMYIIKMVTQQTSQPRQPSRLILPQHLKSGN